MTTTLDWVTGEVAKTWPESCAVIICRPQLRCRCGYIEVRTFFRPDWVGHYEDGEKTFFAKFKESFDKGRKL
jgi:hypothetical protein